MAALTNFMENKLIDWLFRAQAIGITGASAGAGSGPATLYVGLWTNAATLDDTSTGSTANECSGTGYARVAITSSLANWAGTQSAGSTTASSGTGGTTSNNAAITFPAPTGNWGTLSYFGICDASTGGNMLLYGALTTPKTVNSGDAAPTFSIGALTFTLDN